MSEYEQAPPYGGAAPYAQQPYVPAPFAPSAPSAPGTVIGAAVLGFLVGACGVLGTLLVVVFGPPLFEMAARDDNTDDQAAARLAAGLTLLFGALTLAWTVGLIWGALRALRGGGRVPLLVAASVSIAGTLLGLLDVVTGPYLDPGGLVFMLVFLLASLAIVVLLCQPSSTRFFTAHRAAQGR